MFRGSKNILAKKQKKKIDLEKIARGVRLILEGIGEDADRDGRDPLRAAVLASILALLTRMRDLNTELAKKPLECLEYIVVHELVHLLEPTHNARFIAWMDRFMPRWQHHRQVLNRLPVRQETWIY